MLRKKNDAEILRLAHLWKTDLTSDTDLDNFFQKCTRLSVSVPLNCLQKPAIYMCQALQQCHKVHNLSQSGSPAFRAMYTVKSHKSYVSGKWINGAGRPQNLCYVSLDNAILISAFQLNNEADSANESSDTF